MTTDQRVVLFVFGGRRPNLELQLPMIRRILEEHPNAEYHVWNFARDANDRAYIKTISGPRITVFNGFEPYAHMNAWHHYAHPDHGYQDCLFVKMDDDIVFLETARFSKFVEAIDAHRGSVLVANIINNGACTPLTPGIWKGYKALKMHLLDIHLTSDFSDMAHTYFLDHHEEILNQPIELVPSEDWLSINIIGYDWPTACKSLRMMGTPHPAVLAGRPMKGWGGHEDRSRPYGSFGCEGTFNTMTRIVMKGFTAAHLTYGPQNPTGEQLARWRKRYKEVGQEYLASEAVACDDGLPGLSRVSRAQGPPPRVSRVGTNNGALVVVDAAVAEKFGKDDWRTRWTASGENDPTAGRYKP